MMKFCLITAVMLAITSQAVFAGATASDAGSAAVAENADKSWSFSLSAYSYLIPDDRDYIQPTFTADRGRLHFEARYNYEDLETGSAWFGCKFKAGEALSLEFTPMIGGIFGNTRGIAPGYRLSLGWKKLALYSESEYVFDSRSSSDNFAYTWSELTYAPCEWFRAGLVAQRNRLYDTGLDIERGLLVGFSWKQMEFTTCIFNLSGKQPTVVLGVAYRF